MSCSTRESLREKSIFLLAVWFVITKLESFLDEEPARTLDVLDVDGWN